MKGRWRFLGPAVVLILCGASFWLLWHELHQIHFHDVRSALQLIPWWRIAAATTLTAINYLVMVGYDWLAIRAVGKPLSLPRTALVSFAGFVTSNNFGAMLGGTSVRYRLYSAWEFSSVEILQIVAMMAITFWLGVTAVAGSLFALAPVNVPGLLGIPLGTTRPWGIGLLVFTAVYLGLSAIRPSWRWGGTEMRLPGLGTTFSQVAVAGSDFLVASASLYLLVGNLVPVDFWHFSTVVMLAMVATVLSHVPGGVGVFELVVIKACGAEPTPAIVAALLAFRIIYYLLPLALMIVLLAGHEFLHRRTIFSRWWHDLQPCVATIVPMILGSAVFLGGVVLLLSGATPVLPGRLKALELVLPLTVLEASHFLASLSGAGMLLLGIGLQRRLDSAWWMAVGLTSIGALASVLKGLDFEEALFMLLILMALLATRGSFYRKGSLVHSRFTWGWLVAIALAVGCSIWLGLFAHKHAEYSADLWWRFAFRGDASRFLRGTVAAVIVLALFAIRKLLSPAQSRLQPPEPPELDLAAEIISNSPATTANLALLGDKYLLFDNQRTGFVMYGIQGRSWIAMSDPVGPIETTGELIWQFRELVDQYDGWPVFYQVAERNLPLYVNQGLTMLKLGEEARVPLDSFDLNQPSRRSLRQTVRRLEREDCSFEVVAAGEVAEILVSLRSISDAWLHEKQQPEKGFSLGYFQEDYIRRFPCAVVSCRGQRVAFANLWCGANREELSIDLMRYRSDAPSGVMEYLLIEAMQWGASQGYRWFNLGMAPLSGLTDRPLAPLWNRAASALYRHGDALYSFEGLRQYKEKFHPVWTARYLASPGGWALPGILTDLTRLIGRHAS
ncbi:MAG: bifunctional lysylphosphatidylglycerol flippase/synthetase MprF [Pirellulales bacterium]